MADLQSCYFCGRAEDLGAYATPPARLLPANHDPQSAVLCADCRGKLRTVLEPVAERVDALEAAAGTEKDASDTEASAAATDTADDRPAADVATEGGDDVVDEGATVDDGDREDDDNLDDIRADVDDLATEAAAGAGHQTPEGYRRVLRLLENRELPMDREAVVALVSGAYQLEGAQCETILDVAIERGDLDEHDGQITN